ncbi:hypothetical protein ABPG72_000400 [Tetrahymena utriculariae]
MDNKTNNLTLIRVLQIGDLNAGKASLYIRFSRNQFLNYPVMFEDFLSRISRCRQSFDKIHFWYKDYYEKRLIKAAIIALVGNKCDLKHERQVSYQEGRQLAESLGMLFFEVSAKTGYQVYELFESLIDKAININ